MSQRIDKSWLVFDSIENREGDRCVDLFHMAHLVLRNFERDPEDAGAWTPVQFYSGKAFASKEQRWQPPPGR